MKRYALGALVVAVLSGAILVVLVALPIAVQRPVERAQRPPAAQPPRKVLNTIDLPGPDQGVLIANIRPAEGLVLAVRPDRVSVGSAPFGADESRRFSVDPLAPGSHQYMIKTAEVGADGEPDCLARVNGMLVTAACDADAAAQVFEFRPAGTRLYDIMSGGQRVTFDRAGKVSVGSGDSTFAFVPWNRAEDPFDS
jgi:hypothetical protein